MQTIIGKKLTVGKKNPLCLISGPCVIEGEELGFETAERLKKIAKDYGISLVYKSSYDKANRSSLNSFRGPGLEKGLAILEKIKNTYDLPITADIHTPEEAKAAAPVCDLLQIPAFLCRQTDLLIAAGKTGNAVNVKKGQFMAPWDMGNAADKIKESGSSNIILTDRGTTFGYNNLVSDMRSIPIMEKLGYPVCFDASHSVQLPGGHGTSSSGQREFIPTLAKAAIASGATLLFLETHPRPSEAKSDKDSVFPLDDLPKLLDILVPLHALIQKENG